MIRFRSSRIASISSATSSSLSFASLKNNFPDKADALYAKEVEDVKARYARYKKLAED